jgi:hypothetical protein
LTPYCFVIAEQNLPHLLERRKFGGQAVLDPYAVPTMA